MIKFILKFTDKNFLFLSFILIIACFFPLFYFSTKFVINGWAYSDALINYSEGFIRRGLLGEVIININYLTGYKLSIIHSYIFIIFSSLNIVLFISLLKPISDNRFIYFFLLFNPFLLFFPLNDTGGYLRKDIFVVTLMLLHCFFCNQFHSKKINIKKYIILLNFVVIPFIIINTLIHDLQFFLIPFHFFLTLNVVNKDFNILNINSYINRKNIAILIYIFTILPLVVFILNPVSLEKITLVANNILLIDPDVYKAPIIHVSDPFYFAAKNNINFMFSADKLGTYAHLYNYLFLLIISVGSVYLIFNIFLKNKLFIINHNFIFFSVIPLFMLFLIGRDWGRWINMISWCSILFYLQFNFLRIQKTLFLFKKNFYNFISIVVCVYFLFFITVPHCCKQQTIYGGFSDNIILAFNIIFNKSNHINQNFRNIN